MPLTTAASLRISAAGLRSSCALCGLPQGKCNVIVVNDHLVGSAFHRLGVILRVGQNICSAHVTRDGEIRHQIAVPSTMEQELWRAQHTRTDSPGPNGSRSKTPSIKSNGARRKRQYRPPLQEYEAESHAAWITTTFLESTRRRLKALSSAPTSTSNNPDVNTTYDDGDDVGDEVIDESDSDEDDGSDAEHEDNDDNDDDNDDDDDDDDNDTAAAVSGPIEPSATVLTEESVRSLTSAPSLQAFEQLIEDVRPWLPPRLGTGRMSLRTIALCALMHLRLGLDIEPTLRHRRASQQSCQVEQTIPESHSRKAVSTYRSVAGL